MDEMDLEISRDTGEDLSEAEYNDILGLEGMDEKGEADSEEPGEVEADIADESGDTDDSDRKSASNKKKRKKKKSAEELSDEEILSEMKLTRQDLRERVTSESLHQITEEYHTERKAVSESEKPIAQTQEDNRQIDTPSPSGNEKQLKEARQGYPESDFKDAPHRYRQGIDVSATASYAGETIEQMSKDNLRRADENYYAGQKEIRHFSAPLLEAVAVAGALASASSIRDDLRDSAEAAIKASKLIDKGQISVEDLSLPRKELKEKLRVLPAREARDIVKNAGVISDLYAVRSVLIGEGRDIERLPDDIRDYIKTKAFFDLREEKTNEALREYCKRSRNDVLRNANPSGMSSKSIRRHIKDSEKKGLSPPDKSALRLLLRQQKMREARKKVNVLGKIKRYARLASYRITEADDNFVAGVMTSQRVAAATAGIYSTVRFGIKAGAFTHRVWTKYGLVGRQVGRAERFVVRKTADGTRYVLKKTAQGVKAAKKITSDAVSKTKPIKEVKRAVNAAKEAVSHTETVVRLKKAGDKARKIQRTAAVKTARVAYAASKIRDGARIAFTPFRMAKKTIGKIVSFFSGLRAVISAAFFGIIITFAIIVILLTGMLAVFSIEGEAVMNIILCSDEEYVSDTISLLDGYFSEEKDEAMSIATGPPQDPNVFYGHTISRYGAPDKDGNWSDGYKIYYRDMDGNIIENGVNNIKDVIVLAYVMMDGDFDTDTAARDALIGDLWKQLNPEVTWEETDIYTAEIGDDTYSYSCMDSSDYAEMDAMRSEGVRFYESVVPYSSTGCRTITHTHTVSDGNGGTKTETTYEYVCDGHSVSVCYGHKDIKVYITVGFMEDMFEHPKYPTDTAYQEYLSDFKSRGGWTEDAMEWANALYAADWFELYGTDPAGCVGFSVADTLSPEEIASLTEQYGSIDGTRSAVSTFALEMVGKIPYYWGGKPSSGNYEDNHFYADVKSDGSQYNRTKKGLDCSGFVAFVYWHVLGHPLGASSTGDFTNGRYKKISASDLKPGDVGLLRTGYSNGNSVNHIGIFVGRDSSGNAIWVHCTGGSTGKTVCGTFNFSVYYSILE